MATPTILKHDTQYDDALPPQPTPETLKTSKAFACYFCKRTFTAKHLLTTGAGPRCEACECPFALACSADVPLIEAVLHPSYPANKVARNRVPTMLDTWHRLAFPPEGEGLEPVKNTKTGEQIPGYYELATDNRQMLEGAKKAACIKCRRVFAPEKLFTANATWLDDGRTATCPKCGIDAVIPLDPEELKTLRQYKVLANWHRVGFGIAPPV